MKSISKPGACAVRDNERAAESGKGVGFISRQASITPDAVAACLRQISSLNRLFEIDVIDVAWGRPAPSHRSC